MKLKKHISLLMAFIMLFSSIGATGYERYCGCTGEVYSSLFINSKSDCCNHKKSENSNNAVKSCCSISKKNDKKSTCSTDKDKCCDTKVKYSHFEGDAAPAELEAVSALSLFSFQGLREAYKFLSFSNKPICIQNFLNQLYRFGDFPPSPSLSGREILLSIQLIRC